MSNKIHIHDLYFIILLLLLSWLYNYPNILQSGPWMPHMWRQADCLSLTQNYATGDIGFFTPEVHWTGPSGNGKTISEFPLIYYTVGKIWSFTGRNYAIYRIIDILLVFLGLFSLYKISDSILKDKYWAYFIPLILFSSPALVYYTNNFLANAPALGLALTGSWIYILYAQNKQKKWLWISIVIFTLAGMIKITSMIIVVAMLGYLTINALVDLSQRKPNFRKYLSDILPFIPVFMIIVLWVMYTKNYNAHNNEHIFLQGLYPIWDLNTTQINDILNKFYFNVLPSFFNKTTLVVILLIFIADIVFLIRKGQRELLLVPIVFTGVILYLLFWFQALNQHDYYLINLLIFIPVTVTAFLSELRIRLPKFFSSTGFKVIAALLLFLLIGKTTMINRIKYNVEDHFLKADTVFNALTEEDFKFWNYKQTKYSQTLEALDSITPYLRELGIKRNDLVVSIPDVSINITLFLMDQKGFTGYGYSETKGKIGERMEAFKKIGAKYLIVNDSSAVNSEEFKPYLSNKIGEYKNVQIYELETP